MVSGGIPDELPNNQTLGFLKRKARKSSLKELGRISERIGIADFDVSQESGLERAQQKEQERISKKKGIILPGTIVNKQEPTYKDKGFLGL